MMNFKTIKDFNLKGKIVLLRVDLNVPVQNHKVQDATRIDRLKPTIDYLKNSGARTLILSHFGRPKGLVNKEYSLSFLPPVLEQHWNIPVKFADSCLGAPAQTMAKTLQNGEFGLLENLRFHAGEEQNDPDFTRQLAKLGDIYINDAFSASHRAHASTEGLAHIMPSGAGLLMEDELNALNAALGAPQKPVIAIVGGAKISTKLAILDHLARNVDILFLGGGMANTFLHAQNIEIGQSLCEHNMVNQARQIMKTAQDHHCDLMLPEYRIVVDTLAPDAPYDICGRDMPHNKMAVDAAPQSISLLKEKLQTARTVLWNGPLGVFEIKPFDQGTNDAARCVAHLTKTGQLISVAGGGDTISALENAGTLNDFTYVSTAGGAFLEWLEGKPLPGVAALITEKKQDIS